jgi:hypothetical protein
VRNMATLGAVAPPLPVLHGERAKAASWPPFLIEERRCGASAMVRGSLSERYSWRVPPHPECFALRPLPAGGARCRGQIFQYVVVPAKALRKQGPNHRVELLRESRRTASPTTTAAASR